MTFAVLAVLAISAMAQLPPLVKQAPPPLPSEYGTNKTVKARFRPWLPGKSPENVLRCSHLARHLEVDAHVRSSRSRPCPSSRCSSNRHLAPSTLNPTPHTLRPTPYTLPYTLQPTPHTLHTLAPQPSTLNSQPLTIDPRPSTLNSQPSTLNPQPSTLIRKP